MPKPFPKEFREDVVRVARDSDASVAQVAKDFGISESCLQLAGPRRHRGRQSSPGVDARRVRRAARAATSVTGCSSRRTRCCAARRRICRRRTCRENDVPARPRAGRRRDPRRGDVPGAQDRPTALLPVAGRPGHRRRVDRRRTGPTRCSTPTATTRSSATGSWPTRPARPASDGRPHRVADLLDNGWWSVFGKKRGRNGKKAQARHAGLRRPGAARLHRGRRRTSCGWPTSPSTGPARASSTSARSRTCFTNRIVGYSIDSRMKSRLAVAALDNAVARRRADGADVAGCIVHTDRGSQFRSGSSTRADPSRAGRLDGPGRLRRRQRRHGVLLLAAAEERPGPPALGHPRPSCGSPSSPGSNAPTTAAADRPHSAD